MIFFNECQISASHIEEYKIRIWIVKRHQAYSTIPSFYSFVAELRMSISQACIATNASHTSAANTGKRNWNSLLLWENLINLLIFIIIILKKLYQSLL